MGARLDAETTWLHGRFGGDQLLMDDDAVIGWPAEHRRPRLRCSFLRAKPSPGE